MNVDFFFLKSGHSANEQKAFIKIIGKRPTQKQKRWKKKKEGKKY